MKIAVCLSGLTRSLWYTFPLLKEYLIEELKADVFLHTWDIDNSAGRFKKPINSCIFEEKKQYIEKRIKPKAYIIEKYNDFFEKFKEDIIKFNNESTPAMYYSIQKANWLKKEFEKTNEFFYDIVIRIRMDVSLDCTIAIEEFQKAIKDKILFVAWHGCYEEYPHKSATDMFAFSTSKIMDIYSSAFLAWEGNKGLRSENVINQWLTENEINYSWSKTKFKLTDEWSLNKVVFAHANHE